MTETIEALGRKFPCMTGKPGVSPWNAVQIDKWAASGAHSHGERVTARFLLAGWDQSGDWISGRFDLFEALTVWDEKHHAAFLEWVARPWFA